MRAAERGIFDDGDGRIGLAKCHIGKRALRRWRLRVFRSCDRVQVERKEGDKDRPRCKNGGKSVPVHRSLQVISVWKPFETARREFQVNLSRRAQLLAAPGACLDPGRHARQGACKPAAIPRVSGGRGDRSLWSRSSLPGSDGRLEDANSGHGLITERLVYPLDELRDGVLHFERFCGVNLQMKHRGDKFFWKIRLRCGSRQLCGHGVGRKRWPGYGRPIARADRP